VNELEEEIITLEFSRAFLSGIYWRIEPYGEPPKTKEEWEKLIRILLRDTFC